MASFYMICICRLVFVVSGDCVNLTTTAATTTTTSTTTTEATTTTTTPTTTTTTPTTTTTELTTTTTTPTTTTATPCTNDSPTRLEIYFINYTNPFDLRATGQRCDEFITHIDTDYCDLAFDICISPPGTRYLLL